MYSIFLNEQVANKQELEELIKVFLRPQDFMLYEGRMPCAQETQSSKRGQEEIVIELPDTAPELLESGDKRKIRNSQKGFLYEVLSGHTGILPDWGIITGIRPVKLTKELLASEGDSDRVKEILLSEYHLSAEKAALLLSLSHYQRNLLADSPDHLVGIYIGIPFCPTRCIYCSFTSNQAKENEIKNYLKALYKEIDFVADQMKAKGWYPESIYVGGGTPTTLGEKDLVDLLTHINHAFDRKYLKEFTVEAGRPDTITLEKLQAIKDMGVDRISINPQSMKAETLRKIGRAHGPEEIVEAFHLARKAGIPIINADVIAGLPGEDQGDFKGTLDELLALEPENITVHTLAVKRASRLKEVDEDYNYNEGNDVRQMLDLSKDTLHKAHYEPYYLYRQKQMTGNFENVGYARKGTECIYNMRIMDEKQTIIALGAGGISKVYYPAENRLERVPNVSNYQIYMERLEEMLQRKAENIFHIGG